MAEKEQANLLKKSEKSNDGKYENFCDWLTEGESEKGTEAILKDQSVGQKY